MNFDEKIVNLLEDLQAGQKRLEIWMDKLEGGQKRLEIWMDKLEGGQKRLEIRMDKLEGGQERLEDRLERQGKQLEQHGKLLIALMDNMATFFAEQQAQRMDIRSLQTDIQDLYSEVHSVKQELKEEIVAVRTEGKAGIMDLKAMVAKKIDNHEKRIGVLEEDAGIARGDKN